MKSIKVEVEKILLHNGYILCEKVEIENKTKGGIIIPELEKKGVSADNFYKVLKVDSKKAAPDSMDIGLKIDVEVGDIVAINSGHITFISGKEYCLIKQGNVIYSFKNE